MRLSKRDRLIRYLTVEMQTVPHSEFAAQLSLRKILIDAKAAVASGLGRKPRAEAKIHVRIVDVDLTADERYAVILFRLVDADGQDAVYEDMESGEVEPHPKKPGQGNRATAHLVIDLEGKPSKAGQKFRGALEMVSGISISLIEERMSGSLKEFGRGKGVINEEEVKYSTVFSLKPFVDATIRQELTENVLDQFVLVKEKPTGKGIDEQVLVRETKRKIELDVVAVDAKGKLDDIWKVVRKTAEDEGYNLVKAHYHSKLSGKSSSAPIDVHKVNALEDLVSRTEVLKLDHDVHPDQIHVTWHLADKMIARLRK